MYFEVFKDLMMHLMKDEISLLENKNKNLATLGSATFRAEA